MNDKILIIYAHPETEKSHNKEILKNVLKILDNKKIDYKLLDLYKMKFDSILKKEEIGAKEKSKDVLEIQQEIEKRDKLIFIYPIWWGSMPGILKGFCDRVFSAGFAYKYVHSMPKGLLKGKKAFVFATSGAPSIYNFLTCKKLTKGLLKNVLKFCGIKGKSHIFGNCLNVDKNIKRIERETFKKLNNFL